MIAHGARFSRERFYDQVRGQRLEYTRHKVDQSKAKTNATAAYDQKGLSAKVGFDKREFNCQSVN